jgi:hypothetical protein
VYICSIEANNTSHGETEMTVLITEHDGNSVELATEKHHAYVSISEFQVRVLVKPITSRLFGGFRVFDSIDEAIAAYKLPAAKAMLQEAKGILA